MAAKHDAYKAFRQDCPDALDKETLQSVEMFIDLYGDNIY